MNKGIDRQYITKPLDKMLWAICALMSTILVNFVLKYKTSR